MSGCLLSLYWFLFIGYNHGRYLLKTLRPYEIQEAKPPTTTIVRTTISLRWFEVNVSDFFVTTLNISGNNSGVLQIAHI